MYLVQSELKRHVCCIKEMYDRHVSMDQTPVYIP